MENQVREKKEVNYAFKIVGHLGHDNLLFDRTCPACGGMYSSHERSNCPKCNATLTYLTSSITGQPIAISEGTIYPAFSDKQDRKDAAEISSRKNGMPIKHRFKMFSFMDDQGVLVPPVEHGRCREGAKVEILSMNHRLVPSWFMGKDDNNPGSSTKIHWVELLIMVYTNYGDYVKVLTEQEYASKVVHHPVNPDGSATPIDTNGNIQKELEYLQSEIARLQGVVGTQPAQAMSAEVSADSVGEDVPDPFEGC